MQTPAYFVHSKTFAEMLRSGQITIAGPDEHYCDLQRRRVGMHDALPEGQKFAAPPFSARRAVVRAVLTAMPNVFEMFQSGKIEEMQEIAAKVAEGVVPGATFRFKETDTDCLGYAVTVPGGFDRAAVPFEE